MDLVTSFKGTNTYSLFLKTTNGINMYPLNHLKSKLLCSSIILLLTACGGDSTSKKTANIAMPLPIVIDYQKIIDETVSDTIPGIILLVETPEQQFIGSAGLADIESQEAMQTYHIMPNGSAGKKLTALLTAMLEEEGKLNLDNTIDTWLSAELLGQIAHSNKMTLRQLLNHTSGVYDYLDDNAFKDAVLLDPSSLKTDSYALQFALNKPASFEPGEGWDYSNTGYLLVGLILDEILGEHHSSEMRSRILDPLAMHSSHYGGVEKEHGDSISGYYKDEDVGVLNTKPLYENIGVADAPLVASVADMALLLKTIVSGDSFISQHVKNTLYGEDNLQLMGDSRYYGQGIIKGKRSGKTIYRHGGLELGYSTTNIYIQENQTSITAFFNCGGFESCETETDAMIEKVLLNELQ
jgi:D-alanyl-D-alanine carboxypeptidase